MLTYKQAYDLLIDAYYKDEILPYDQEFCFCGNLNENNGNWFYDYADTVECHKKGINYSGVELYRMEHTLLSHISDYYFLDKYEEYIDILYLTVDEMPDWEDVLFEGFCKALDVLKQIHIERGEVIDEVCELSKRVLVK